MSNILEKENMPRYLRVYNYYKELILSGQLQENTKLPSIRKASVQLQVSRTTMENAYMLLAAEGYILAKPQSGYYVTNIVKKQSERDYIPNTYKKREHQEIKYDFMTSNVDRESFHFELWRRYMKSALRQDERLLSYGEPQGEADFREVLCDYLQQERSVVCSPEQIVIGAGVQSLLNILCPLIAKRKKVAFNNPKFTQGKAVFEDYGYEFCETYEEIENGIYYISPSQLTSWGGVMTIAQRMKLINEAQRWNFLIIEDDYNSEFRYSTKPTPSLQGLAAGQGVVYLGTFSKMLLPSIRMSFMVLPTELLEAYENRREMYNQTASKAEQIAITQFIRDGHLSRQIRKSRKIHLAKVSELAHTAKKIFGKDGKVEIGESGFQVYLKLRTKLTTSEIQKRAATKGIAIRLQPENSALPDNNEVVILLNCANVSVEDYEVAISLLKECL